MAKFILIVLLVGALAAGAYVYMHYTIVIRRDQQGQVQTVTLTRRADGLVDLLSDPTGSVRLPRPVIRIATFHADRLTETKLANRQISDVLVRMISQFEVVAIQDIRARNLGLLSELIEMINATGKQYNFATCPTAQRDSVQCYSAFVYDETGIDVDRTMVHSVDDPQGRFRHPPLVGLFRAKEPAVEEAFTFKLISVHIDSSRAGDERDLLDDVYRAVRDDPPEEDDVILLGTFGGDINRMNPLAEILDVTAAIVDTPTTLRGTRPIDNILFNRRASTEFTGRADVMDLVRKFELTLPDAQEVSDHLPVWAEFSSYEGGVSGRVSPPSTESPH